MKKTVFMLAVFMSGVAQAALINGAKVVDFDTIEVDLTYGGGCKKHNFKLEPTFACTRSIPSQCTVVVVDLTKDDKCRALVPTKVKFSLSEFGLDKGVYEESILTILGDAETSAKVTPVNARQIYENLNVEEKPLPAERTKLVYKKSVGGLSCVKTDDIRTGVSYECSFN